MLIVADYHTHTRMSHGKGTIEENVIAAIEKGLKAVAVTDHGFAHIAYGMTRREARDARREVDALSQRYQRDITILLGVEANLTGLDGTVDIGGEKGKYFDIVLMGHHKAALPSRFSDFWHFFMVNELGLAGKSRKARVTDMNTKAYIRAVEKYDIDIIVHPMYAIDVDIGLLARACAEKGTAIEINSAHMLLTLEQIRLAKAEGARFVINSDAHMPRNVGDFGFGIQTALEAGLTEDDIINAAGYSGKLPKNLEAMMQKKREGEL